MRTRTWFLLSVLLFVGAGFFWHLGEERVALRRTQRVSQARPANPSPATNFLHEAALTPVPRPLASPTNRTGSFPYRLGNTTQSIGQLSRSESAILLQNALIDTAAPTGAPIPAHLKAGTDPGSYIVQARGHLDQPGAFQDQIRKAGGQVVSYIPNNAYLIEIGEAGAKQLSGLSQVQAVLPYEPYYKLDDKLLPLAVDRKALPENALLNVVLFPGQAAAAKAQLTAMGVTVVGEDQTPFGPQAVIKPASDILVALARMSSVQRIEVHHQRALLNDKTRLRVGIDIPLDGLGTTTNYLGLSGTNILVNVNDSGGDSTHPDLVGRIIGTATNDFDGHGTHVMGIIASAGTNSPSGTNAVGSLPNANFRGMAPMAKIFSLPIDLLTGPFLSDTYLQETAASTNAFISNNSWGYVNASDYNTAAASYDAAVRDAQPGVTGARPLLYVFAAGNAGGGQDDGLGGLSDTISSPGTAKNVITVGAIENLRNITNEVVIQDQTNAIFKGMTDSSKQVASFSSRGNVGIGVEGEAGRFKPDLVAPGTFIVSTRATNYVDPNQLIDIIFNTLSDQMVPPGQTNIFQVIIPNNVLDPSLSPTNNNFTLKIRPNALSPNPFPNLPVYADKLNPPLTFRGNTNDLNFSLLPGTNYFSIKNPGVQPVHYDAETYIIITNEPGNLFQVLSNLNQPLAPYYRYETGTSMAAPAVSGVLALMQEFFEQRLGRTNSPALMKALLINGARSVDNIYNFGVTNNINDQGWGLVNIRNSIPAALSDTNNPQSWPIQFFDQSPTNALATGRSHTYFLNMSTATNAPAGNRYPLRMTLVWTDPPGNPAASVKLVNDLDLIVTNLDTGEVFLGNNFPASDDPQDIYFTAGSYAGGTTNLDFTRLDSVNNVENVYLGNSFSSLGTNYSVTVQARRVNVNAVPQHTNDIVQDYALVISSGNLALTNAFTITNAATPLVITNAPTFVTTATNGSPLLFQRVGANSPLVGTSDGESNQWHFFVFENVTNEFVPTNGPYLAFATFLPPNLSKPRNLEADIDMYVSTDSNLTNFSASAIANSVRSRGRTGSELILLTNNVATRFYVGIKAEDQQAAEFGFFAVSSPDPFSQKDKDGNVIVRGYPLLGVTIPDGSPDRPQGVLMLGIAVDPVTVQRVILTNQITHELFGDLLSQITHGSKSAVLQNHTDPGTNASVRYIYDDSQQGDILPGIPPLGVVDVVKHSDGPGDMRQFMGEQGAGLWTLTVIDNAINHTGRVDSMTIRLEPKLPTNNITATIGAGGWFYDYLDVPEDATNLTISVSYQSGGGPLDLYLRKGDFPDPANFDKATNGIVAPGGALTLSTNEVPPIPPLTFGRYYFGLHNVGSGPVTVVIRIRFDRSLIPALTSTFFSSTNVTLLDDARTTDTITVTNNQSIVAAQVGVRIDHPRVSDLVLYLTSPQGTRILLSEARGGTNGFAYGTGYLTNGINYTIFTENTNLSPQLVKFAQAPFANITVTPPASIFSSDFEVASGNYANQQVDGWNVSSNKVQVYNLNPLANSGSSLLALQDGIISRVVPTTAGQAYVLSYAYLGLPTPGPISWWKAEFNALDTMNRNHGAIFGGTTYAPGMVAEGFKFDGVSGYMIAPASASLNVGAGPGFTVEAWINPTDVGNGHPIAEWCNGARVGSPYGVHFWVGHPARGPGYSYANIIDSSGGFHVIDTADGVMTANTLQHVAVTYDKTTGIARILRNGVIVSQVNLGIFTPRTTDDFYIGRRPPGDPFGNSRLFTGVIDELSIYGRALTLKEIQAIYAAGSAGKCLGTCPIDLDVTIDGNNSKTYTTSSWQTNQVSFVATNTSVTIAAHGGQSGVLVDSFNMITPSVTNNRNSYLPEESIRDLVGQNAFGSWTLEVWDTRTGAIVTNNNQLISWELQLTMASTNLAVTSLTNGVAFTGSLVGNEIKYFMVDVPTVANFATNTLSSSTGGGLDLLFDQTALPTGSLPGDFLLLSGTTAGKSVLGVGGQPPLQTGHLYFLGVRNTNPAQSNNFSLQVDFDRSPGSLTSIGLTNGLGYTNSSPASSAMQYYYFDVSPSATSVAFELLNLSGDVDLYVSRGTMPTVSNYDYGSFNGSTNGEQILLTPGSTPVALTPGRWYLGVQNFLGSAAVTYTVRATEVAPNVVVLTDNVPVTFTNTPAGAYSNFFRFDITATNPAVRFLATNLTGDVDLVLSRGYFPTPFQYDFGSFNGGNVSEQILLSTNSVMTNLNGTWFLSLPNNSTGSVTFTLVATLSTNGTNFPLIGSRIKGTTFAAPGGGFTIVWDSIIGQNYAIDFSAALPTWTPLVTVQATSTQSSYTDNSAPPGGIRFYRIRSVP